MMKEITPGLASAATHRNHSIDIVKGIAITLVVFGHTLQGVGHRGWWDTPGSLLLNDFIYSFHMPVFFFVSGLLVAGSLARRTPAHFVADKVRTILYPYLLWVLITMAERPFTARFRSTAPISTLSYLGKALTGDQSWFLECLFFIMLLTLLTSRLPDWFRALLAVLLCIALPISNIGTIDQVAREWAFFAVGQLIGGRIAVLIHLRRRYAALMLIIIAALQLAAVAYLEPAFAAFFLRAHALFLVLGLSGIVGLFCLARLLHGTAAGHLAAWTGEASIAIYLMHPYLQGGTRQAILVLFHTHHPLPHLLLTTTVSTLVPAMLWHARDRLRIGWLFRWGRSRRRERLTLEAETQPVQG